MVERKSSAVWLHLPSVESIVTPPRREAPTAKTLRITNNHSAASSDRQRAPLPQSQPHGVEWRQYTDRYGRRLMPLPDHWHISSGRSRSEARRWADGPITAEKYRIPGKQRPNRVVGRWVFGEAGRPASPVEVSQGNTLIGQRTDPQYIPHIPFRPCYRRKYWEHFYLPLLLSPRYAGVCFPSDGLVRR